MIEWLPAQIPVSRIKPKSRGLISSFQVQIPAFIQLYSAVTDVKGSISFINDGRFSLLPVKKLKGNDLKGLKFAIRHRKISITPGSFLARCNCTNLGAKGTPNH